MSVKNVHFTQKYATISSHNTGSKNMANIISKEAQQLGRVDSVKSAELLKKGISGITIVVPSLDESSNIFSLRDSLRLQRKYLDPTINLRVVISDNGSSSDTQDVYKQILREEESQSDENKLDIAVIYGSKKGFNSSARSEGLKDAIKIFHEIDPQKSPDNHLILSFDADSAFEKKDALQTLVQRTFTDPNTMVAFGPIKFISSTGEISSDYEAFQRPFTRILLGHLFRLNGKRMKDYINPPHEIFHGIFTAIRESALVQKDNPNNIVVNYKPTDRAGVDVRMSLLLQRHVQKSQIAFDKDLTVITSARGYETKKGHVSRLKFIKKTFKLFFGTHYVPYALQRELDTLPEDQRLAIAKNIRFVDVIGSFARDVDREIYNLEESEQIVGIVNQREAQRRKQKGFKVLPSRDLKTGVVIQNQFVIVERENK